jgi:hypothetical protein
MARLWQPLYQKHAAHQDLMMRGISICAYVLNETTRNHVQKTRSSRDHDARHVNI